MEFAEVPDLGGFVLLDADESFEKEYCKIERPSDKEQQEEVEQQRMIIEGNRFWLTQKPQVLEDY